ncbi:hypothetical protein CERZMDRAFT_92833 [Cercospora zeae-maydis SCOH1-5]|uniref:Uncharacterized protein n=1 Tax=Cercospora zeae-maydis SCOH1-5 TaxID=717836 RepID=A0A6A6FU16_9PEZI|nr:hypothetical protein CERZMDRAFT_92833 [Cercospora zeae-maydis SCOH1-5]
MQPRLSHGFFALSTPPQIVETAAFLVDLDPSASQHFFEQQRFAPQLNIHAADHCVSTTSKRMRTSKRWIHLGGSVRETQALNQTTYDGTVGGFSRRRYRRFTA